MLHSGIYITGYFIRITYILRAGNGHCEFKEHQLDITSLRKEDIPLHLQAFLKKRNIISGKLTIGIARSRVLVKYLSVPSVDSAEIKGIIEHKLKDLFPYKLGELVFDEAVIEISPDGYSRVMIAAVPGNIVLREISLFEKAGLTPDRVELSAVSLFNQACKSRKDCSDLLLINLEDNFLDIVVVRNGKFNFSRGMELDCLGQEQKLAAEISRTIYVQKAKGVDFKKIILSGRGVDLKNLAFVFEKTFGIDVEIDKKICVTNGLVLGAVDKEFKIDLLPEEFKLQKTKAGRIKAFVYFITLFVLNISLVINIVFLRIREKQEYLNFLRFQILTIENRTALLQEKMLKLNVFKHYFGSDKFVLELLAELYRITPEGVYFTSLEVEDLLSKGALTLAGQAKDNKVILRFSSLIKDSPLFGEANVRYIKKNESASTGMVDFKIRSAF